MVSAACCLKKSRVHKWLHMGKLSSENKVAFVKLHILLRKTKFLHSFLDLSSRSKKWQNSWLTTEETCQIAERPRVDENLSVRTRFYIMARLVFLCVQQNLVYCLRRKKEKETSGTS